MITNLMPGIGSGQGMISNLQINVNQSQTSDFSQVLKNSSDKAAAVEDSGNGTGRNTETNRYKDTEKTQDYSKEDTKVTSDEPVEKEDDLSTDKAEEEEDFTEALSEVKEDRKPVEDMINTEEVMEIINTAAVQIENLMAETFEVSTEEVDKALTELDLETVDLLNPEVIPKVAVEVKELADTMDIMTNEELYKDVKMLMTEAEDLTDQLSQELEIPVKTLKQQISSIPVIEEELRPIIVNEDQGQVETGEEMISIDTIPVGEDVHIEQEADSSKDGKSNNSHNDKNTTEYEPSHFMQSITDNIERIVTEKVNETPASYVADPADIMEQVKESLRIVMKDDMTEMEMQLHPASLGNVKVQVAIKDGAVTANFTTQNEQVKAVLESQLVQLKEQMNEQGLKIEAVEVTVSSHSFESNLQNGRGNGQEPGEPKKKTTRSINLNSLEDDPEMDNEEDSVLADMMARQGNSVDYLT